VHEHLQQFITVPTLLNPNNKKQHQKQQYPAHQTSLRGAFSKPFDSLVCDCTVASESGYCTSETSATVADAMKRYGRYIDHGTTPTTMTDLAPFYPIAGFTINEGIPTNISSFDELYCHLNYLTYLFWFRRGDLRFRILDFADYTGHVAATMNDFTLAPGKVSNGMSFAKFPGEPQLAFEWPYSAVLPYFPTQGPVNTGDIEQYHIAHCGIDNLQENMEVYIAAGDNYLCGMIAPPPIVLLAPPTPKIPTRTLLKSSTKPQAIPRSLGRLGRGKSSQTLQLQLDQHIRHQQANPVHDFVPFDPETGEILSRLDDWKA